MHGPAELVLSTCTVAIIYAVPQTAAAQSQSRSNGGYTRPGGSSKRTPSFGGSARDRKPSMSGGCDAQAPPCPVAPVVQGACPGRRATRHLHANPRAMHSQPSVSDRSPGLPTSAFDRVVWIVGWGAATRRDLGDDSGPRGDSSGRWDGATVLCRPRPASVWHVEYHVLVVSPRHTSATRAYGLLPQSVPLIRAMPHGGRMRTGGLQATRRCAKSWLSWIRGSRPCRRNPGSKITYHPMRHPPLPWPQTGGGAPNGGWGHSIPGARGRSGLVGLARLSAGQRCAGGRRSKSRGLWHVLSAGLVPRWHDVPGRSYTVHSCGQYDACAGPRGGNVPAV